MLQQKLFDIEDPLLSYLQDESNELDPQFRAFALRRFRTACNGSNELRHLFLVPQLEVLRQTEPGADEIEALRVLNEACTVLRLNIRGRRIVWADFQTGSSAALSRLRREARIEADGEEPSSHAPHRSHGRIGHQVVELCIPKLLATLRSGSNGVAATNGNDSLRLPMSVGSAVMRRVSVEPSTNGYHPVQPTLLMPELPAIQPALIEALGCTLQQLQELEQRLETARRILSWKHIYGRRTNWWAQYRRCAVSFRELQRLLRPLIGSSVDELIELRSTCPDFKHYNDYLALLSLVSWGTALVSCLKPVFQKRRKVEAWQRVLFTEITVLAPHHGVSGGRIDAIEVVAINGHPPTAGELGRLSQLSQGWRLRRERKSVGYLLRRLRHEFGDNLSVRILDFKFAVGDANIVTTKAAAAFCRQTGKDEHILRPDQLPLSSHVAQLERYLCLAAVDDHLLNGPKHKGASLRPGVFTQGSLIYLLPTVSEPLEHEVKLLDLEAHERVFRQAIVWLWHRAGERSHARHITNLLANRVSGTRNGNGNGGHSDGNGAGQNGKTGVTQSTLFSSGELDGSWARLVDNHRHYLDRDPRTRLVEQVGISRRSTPPKPIYAFHLERLEPAAKLGAVTISDQWDSGRGGKISCPVHDPKDPKRRGTSLHIFLDTAPPSFHCFRCGCSGFVIDSARGANGHSASPLRQYERARQQNQRIWEIAIPERLTQVMLEAQLSLHVAFPGSPAERYLVRERHLDPELAYTLGAGYGSDQFVIELLEAGVSYEELIHYGFLGFSAKISEDFGVVPLLRKYGLTRIGRPVMVKGVEKRGLPFGRLSNRVTFPLELSGSYNNFYGRSILPGDKALAHRKLSKKHHGVPHGLFFEDMLLAGRDEVIIVEAPIDAVTLVQLGYPAIGIIGSGNKDLIELIARAQAGRGISLGFDNDKAGRDATANALEHLGAIGFDLSRVSSFTERFFAGRPEDERVKDFNKWWNDFGHYQS